MNNRYVYVGLQRRMDQTEWTVITRPYEMKHHAKLKFPKDMQWVPDEKLWYDNRTGYCYKVQRSGEVWEDVE